MGFKVYTGLPDEEVEFLEKCLSVALPDATIERIPLAGVRSKIRNTGASADVVLIILEETYYNKCAGVAMNVLSLPKTHKWVSREGLISFLKTQLGDFEVPVSSSNDDNDTLFVSDTSNDSPLILSEEDDTSQDQALEKAKEENAQLREQLDELRLATENKIPEYIQQIDQLNKEISSLRTYKDLSETQKESILSLESKIQELTSLYDKSKLTIQEYEGKEKTLTGKIETISTELEGYKSKIAELENKTVELQGSNDTISLLTEELESVRAKLADTEKTKILLENEVKSYMTTISNLEKEVSALNTKLVNVGSLELKIETLTDQNATLSSNNEQLQEKLKEFQGLEESFDNLEKVKEDLESTLQSREQEKKVLEDKLSTMQEQLETVNSKVEETGVLEDRIKEIEDALDDKDIVIQGLNSQIADLKVQLADSQGTIDNLKQELANSLAEATNSQELNDLKLVLQQSQLSVSSLELENDTLGCKLDEAKQTVSNLKEQLESSQKDLEKTQQQLSQRDLQLSEKADMLNEISEDIYYKVSNTCTPKAGVQLSVLLDSQPFNNIVVTASGSSESIADTAKFIHSEVEQAKDKKFIVIDLGLETFLDSQLGVKAITSPIKWLQGGASIKEAVSDTKYANVKALMLAVSYINDSYLLAVDWKSRLEELRALDMTIIINIGCINNLVQNILFNTFAKLCRSHIIVNGSPSNLRACILHISAFTELQKLSVLCVRYSDISRGMFMKLSEKANARILQKGETIGI